jgi:hypothetical protein
MQLKLILKTFSFDLMLHMNDEQTQLDGNSVLHRVFSFTSLLSVTKYLLTLI